MILLACIFQIGTVLSIPATDLPAIAFTHAGALLSLLTWWLDRGMRESPAQMDELFHRLIWNGVSR